MDLLRDFKPDFVDRPQAVAGLSLGEYTALVAAGVLTFEQALNLLMVRSKAMQRATDATPQATCSVAGLTREKLDPLLAQAKAADPCKNPQCQIASVLVPSGFTCAGTKEAINKLCQLAVAQKALQARVIKAGGAYHTPLMDTAAAELSDALDEMLPRMKPPKCTVYFNVTGKRISAGDDPSTFIGLMKKQLTSEVLWETTVQSLIMDGVKFFFECGPLKQLKAMIKRIDSEAFKVTENVSV